MHNIHDHNNFTIEQMRIDICAEIFKKENEDLHYLLYFGSDLLEPEDWNEVMIQVNEDTLPCDLVFVQLAANFFKKRIILIPVKQPNEVKDPEELKKKILKVIPNELTNGPTFVMLYFPQGEFGPQNHFQSVFIDNDLAKSSTTNDWISYDEEVLKKKLEVFEKPINFDDIDAEEEESEDENYNLSSERRKNVMKSQKRNIKKTRKNTGNAYNNVTMITPVDPTARVIVNTTNKTIKKKVNRKSRIYEIAPGEGKVCML